MATGKSQKQASGGCALGFEAKLWAAADKLRGNLNAAEYKHVVLGLIFLEYISDESRTLAALRDALLPKLLSGKLRLPSAAKALEATV